MLKLTSESQTFHKLRPFKTQMLLLSDFLH